MNSRERRTTERRWPYSVAIDNDDELLAACSEWLWTNFGTCQFNSRANPRWCFRLTYIDVSFARYANGAQIYFRKERDYLAFLLKWC